MPLHVTVNGQPVTGWRKYAYAAGAWAGSAVVVGGVGLLLLTIAAVFTIPIWAPFAAAWLMAL